MPAIRFPRNYSSSSSAVDSNVCDAIRSGRTYGVELEFVGIGTAQAVTALSNAGISINPQVSYNHHNSRSHWKVVTDASVHGTGGSGELVSPILSGVEGLEQIRKAVRAMAEAGATVNRSCGLHVHINANDLDSWQFANVISRYAYFESALDSIMPPSRRGNNNRYCSSIVSWVNDRRRWMESASVRTIADYAPRSKVNLGAYLRHGTIEFRHHSGSMNAEKVVNWVQFCVNFFHASIQRTVDIVAVVAPTVARATNSRTLRKLHAIVIAFEDWGACDVTTLARATGYNPRSIPVMISKLRTEYGFSIRKSRGYYRLIRRGSLPSIGARTTSTASTTSIPSTYTGTAFDGLPTAIVGYYNERREELRAS